MIDSQASDSNVEFDCKLCRSNVTTLTITHLTPHTSMRPCGQPVRPTREASSTANNEGLDRSENAYCWIAGNMVAP